MTICSENLHRLVVEGRILHPGMGLSSIATLPPPSRSPPSRWRLVKSSDAAQIDAVIALAMSAERASTPAAAPPKLLGWI